MRCRALLTSQSLKEDKDRSKYQGKAVDYSTNAVRGSHRIGNQKVECKAHDQENDEPLDPRHVGLLILPVFTSDYSNTVPHVQGEHRDLAAIPVGSRRLHTRLREQLK
jgi:hypothetical protein